MAEKLYYDSATGTTFKEAFADARKEGKKIFEWNGKKYNTKLKGEDEPKQGKYKESDTIKRGMSEKSAPKAKEDKEEDKGSRGTAAGLLGAATGLGAAAALAKMRKAEAGRKEGTLESMAKERENRAKSGTSLRMPGSSMDKNDPYSMTLGSDLDPKTMMRNRRMSGDADYKKGGKVRKFAGGGMYENIPAKPPTKSSGSVKGEKIPGGPPKKSAPPLPEWLKNERENQERDRRVKKEQEAYEKYDKTRLKDQGSFKKGGMTASRRGDGIAMRGKTRGKVI